MCELLWAEAHSNNLPVAFPDYYYILCKFVAIAIESIRVYQLSALILPFATELLPVIKGNFIAAAATIVVS